VARTTVGDRRQVVTVLSRVLAPRDTFGQQKQTWADGDQHFAKQEAPGDSEQVSSPGMASSRGRVRFRVRGWVAVAAVERVRWENTGQVFEVVGTFRDGLDTVVDCTEVQGGGTQR
jgi:head-tail adaptor